MTEVGYNWGWETSFIVVKDMEMVCRGNDEAWCVSDTKSTDMLYWGHFCHVHFAAGTPQKRPKCWKIMLMPKHEYNSGANPISLAKVMIMSCAGPLPVLICYKWWHLYESSHSGLGWRQSRSEAIARLLDVTVQLRLACWMWPGHQNETTQTLLHACLTILVWLFDVTVIYANLHYCYLNNHLTPSVIG